MGATQKDIAEALDISLITVHRALNGKGYVSGDLKERILTYAKKVNYVPHRASQILVRNKTRRIAVFSSSLPHYFWNDIRKGITVAAEQLLPFQYDVNYHMIPERDSRAYLAMLEREVKGGLEAVAFVNQWMYDMERIIERIERAGLPYVTLNVDAPNSRRLYYVGPDYRAGGRLAAEFIAKALTFKERPRVLVINTEADRPLHASAPDINKERQIGFEAVLRRDHPNIALDVAMITSRMGSRQLDAQMSELLAAWRGKVHAVYLAPAFNSQFLKSLEALGYRRTITVLHDLDSSSNHFLERKLLTAVIYQNPILQGYYAVKILENLLESGDPPESTEVKIEHSILLDENKNLYRNHYLFTRLHL